MKIIEFIGKVSEARLNRVDAKTRERVLKNELVRCQDCRFQNEKTKPWLNDGYTHCKHVNWWNGPDDFCSYGKKKSNE